MKIYYIEYHNSIKFFGGNGNTLDIPKTRNNYYKIQKLKNDKRFKLVSLI